MYLPMLTDNITRSNNNLRKLSDMESGTQNLLSSDGLAKPMKDVDNAGKVINLECQQEEIAAQRKNNARTIERQKFQTNQIVDAQEVLTKFRLSVSQARSPTNTSNGIFKISIENSLELLNNVMNNTFGNEYPMSGSGLYTKTTTKLSDLTPIGMISADEVDTSYYTGGGNGDVVYVDSNTTIDRGNINGSHEGFEKLIRALRLSMSADESDSTDERYDKISTLLEEASDALGEALVHLGSIQNTIDRVEDNLQQLGEQVDAQYKIEAQADQFETFESWQKAKTQLEISRNLASFQLQETTSFIEKILS